MRNVPDAWQEAEQMKKTLRLFHGALGTNGIRTTIPVLPCPRLDLAGDAGDESKLSAMLDSIINHSARVKLLLVVLPRFDISIYNHVKHLGDVKRGIHTICVIGSKFAKEQRQDQYFANVALKFNLKLGGINQTLQSPKLGIIAEGKTMVVGLDVTHPSPGSVEAAPSVAGIVASIDKELGQWPAEVCVQASRQEMVSGLEDMLKNRLRLWQEHNKNILPENILVYRDGVSEGQYQTVLRDELPLMRRACATLYPAPDTKKGLPYFTIIIVGKRHHTRFYPTKAVDADKSSNPRNGTVVDRGVTETRQWDFFLQAHSALKGTARPAHYYVVIDEIFRKRAVKAPFKNTADVLEDLTHNMCYLFGRATKAVSICPPAYYADLVCERARCYLSGLFDASPAPSDVSGQGGSIVDPGDVRIHANLRDTMFYI